MGDVSLFRGTVGIVIECDIFDERIAFLKEQPAPVMTLGGD